MDELLKALGVVIGGGSALGLIAAIVVFVTKGAIEKAVALAGERELERFKAELTLEAEVRRMVAAKKVEALLKIIEGQRALESQSASASAKELLDLLKHYFHSVRNAEPFCTAATADELSAYGKYAEQLNKSYDDLRSEMGSDDFPDKFNQLWDREQDQRKNFLALIRAELGVGIRPQQGKS